MISVVIPIYKAEKYLEKCIDSVLAQSYSALEVILVDDGSPDGCPQICDSYEKKDGRIKVIHKENGGLSSARNVGIEYATGDWIAFIDSDDYIDRNMFQGMLHAATESNADLVLCNYYYIKESGEVIPKQSPLKNEVLSARQAMEKLQEAAPHYYITACNKLYKKGLFDHIRFPIGKVHEDQFVVHRLFHECHIIRTLDAYYYYYVQTDHSIMRSETSASNLDDVEAILDRVTFFRENGYVEMIPGALSYAYQRYHHIKTNAFFHDIPSKRRLKETSRILLQAYHTNNVQLYSNQRMAILLPVEMQPIKKVHHRIREFFHHKR